MEVLRILSSILYLISAAFYITYLCNQESIFMFIGGLVMLTASMMAAVLQVRRSQLAVVHLIVVLILKFILMLDTACVPL